MNPESKISLDDFKKVELMVGKILSAEKVPETDKLLKLMVDFGVLRKEQPPKAAPFVKGDEDHPTSILPSKEGRREERDVRQIISGIAPHFPDPQVLVGRKSMFVTNIPVRIIRGLESNGMILAVSTVDGTFSLLAPNDSIPEGTKAT